MRLYPTILMSEESRRKNREALLLTYQNGRQGVFKGEKRPEHSIKMKELYMQGIMKPVKMLGETNPAWKGEKAGYHAIHKWLYKRKNKFGICEHCGQQKKTQFANISGKYLRNIKDFLELCRKCHYWFDKRLD